MHSIVPAVCRSCGKDFLSKSSNPRGNKYCSRACLGVALSLPSNVVCQTCGKAFHLNPSRALTRRYCSDACWMAAPVEFRQTMDVKERFWAKVDKTSNPFGCHIWTGALVNGYGSFYHQGDSIPAHRMAWILQHGPIPVGMYVLHKCEHFYLPGDITCRSCIRHLSLGTPKENTEDIRISGRRITSRKK